MKKILLLVLFCSFQIICLSQGIGLRYRLAEQTEDKELLCHEKAIILHQSRIYDLPLFDVNKLLAEDQSNDGRGHPFRFGKGFDVCYSLNDGIWNETVDGRISTL